MTDIEISDYKRLQYLLDNNRPYEAFLKAKQMQKDGVHIDVKTWVIISKCLGELSDAELLNIILKQDQNAPLLDCAKTEVLTRLSTRSDYIRFWKDEYFTIESKYYIQRLIIILLILTLAIVAFWK